MSDRIVYDGPGDDDLNEIVLSNVSIHLERTSQHDWHVVIWRDGYQCLDLRAGNLRITEQIGFSDLVRHDPPLLGCNFRWDAIDKEHRCQHDKVDHKGSHVCDCGTVLDKGWEPSINLDPKTWPWPAEEGDR